MFTLMIVFALASQPQTRLNLNSISAESCRVESLAVETVFRSMGVIEYSTRCVER
jgi:hypothetical protein